MRTASRTVTPAGTRGRCGTNARIRASARPRSRRTSWPIQRTLAAGQLLQPGRRARERRLAGAVRPDDGDELAAVDAQVGAVQDRRAADRDHEAATSRAGRSSSTGAAIRRAFRSSHRNIGTPSTTMNGPTGSSSGGLSGARERVAGHAAAPRRRAPRPAPRSRGARCRRPSARRAGRRARGSRAARRSPRTPRPAARPRRRRRAGSAAAACRARPRRRRRARAGRAGGSGRRAIAKPTAKYGQIDAHLLPAVRRRARRRGRRPPTGRGPGRRSSARSSRRRTAR